MQQKSPDKLLSKSPDGLAATRLEYLPSIVSMLRLAILPFFAYAFFFGLTFVGRALFLLAIATDFADGYVAKKLGVTSKFGAYYDATVDAIFILTMFGVFFVAGCYPYWVLSLILFVYIQFIITSFTCKITYDPVGKYYGSLLYGAIGLTLLFSGKVFYDFVTVSIVFVTAASLFSRVTYYLWSRKLRNTDR